MKKLNPCSNGSCACKCSIPNCQVSPHVTHDHTEYFRKLLQVQKARTLRYAEEQARINSDNRRSIGWGFP